jgi:hypothetical protein
MILTLSIACLFRGSILNSSFTDRTYCLLSFGHCICICIKLSEVEMSMVRHMVSLECRLVRMKTVTKELIFRMLFDVNLYSGIWFDIMQPYCSYLLTLDLKLVGGEQLSDRGRSLTVLTPLLR